MPVRPEQRGKYPKNWPAIRRAILERARHCCEWPGCLAPNYEWIRRNADDLADWLPADALIPVGLAYRPPVQIILTISHTDHDPQNNDPANLRALCQLHHLRHDAGHHATTRRETRALRSGQRRFDF